MHYTNLAQLTARYGAQLLLQLTDRTDPPLGAVDAALLEQVLTDTDAVIDGYLAGRYVLPLATIPPQLPSIAQAIAIYRLHVYEPEAKIAKEYDGAIADLVRIANGTIRLPVAGVEPVGTDASGVVVIDRERDMTPDNLAGFI